MESSLLSRFLDRMVWTLMLLILLTRFESSQSTDHSIFDAQQRRMLRKTPDTRAHPGLVDLPLHARNRTLHLIRCRNYASAYSAAWLAPVQYVLRTKYANRPTLEWHSHNLYQSNEAGAYKLEEFDTFFVNHISEFEHYLMRHGSKLTSNPGEALLSHAGEKAVAEMVSTEHERVCSLQDTEHRVRTRHHTEIAGIIPFYPGAVGDRNKTGNAHSVSSSAAKASWLRVVACSLSPFMSTLLVGTCSREHAELARTALGLTAGRGGDGDSVIQDGWPFPATHVEVAELICELPVYLPYVLLRNAQARLSSSTSSGTRSRHAPRGQRSSSSSSLGEEVVRKRTMIVAPEKGRKLGESGRVDQQEPQHLFFDESGGARGCRAGCFHGRAEQKRGVEAKRGAVESRRRRLRPRKQASPSSTARASWSGVRFLYFTEMDNVLHVSDLSSSGDSSSPPPSPPDSPSSKEGGNGEGDLLWDTLIGFLDGRLGATGYVSPNRFHKKPGTGPRQIGPRDFTLNGQNKCARD